jgi:acid phosphatase (class A)
MATVCLDFHQRIFRLKTMNIASQTILSRYNKSFTSLLLASSVIFAVADGKESKLSFLKEGNPSAVALLAPPPLPDSAEQAADLETVRTVYHSASDTDKQAAYSEKKFSVFNFTDAVGPFFVETNLPKTTAFFEKVQKDAETVTDLGKDYFHRPRPYTTDTNLINGKLEKSFSYPSGHSTESMVLALVLAEMLPEKSDAIITHARLMGWHRVQIARHYPTDIYAGRVLAQAIVKQFKKSDEFEKAAAEAKAEIEAVRKAALN